MKTNKGNALIGGLVLVGIIGVLSAIVLSALNSASADKTESERVEQQQDIYVDSQQIPAFDWSLERHIYIELYKARNNAVTTYSYVRNWEGEVYFSCKSIGFPLPANMQLTNPEKTINEVNGGDHALPQAEPNGLYTSPSSVGTYIFCVNSDGTISPSYFEDKAEAHLAPLNDAENGLSGDGGLKIDVDAN